MAKYKIIQPTGEIDEVEMTNPSLPLLQSIVGGNIELMFCYRGGKHLGVCVNEEGIPLELPINDHFKPTSYKGYLHGVVIEADAAAFRPSDEFNEEN
jgi:hypothetical protein